MSSYSDCIFRIFINLIYRLYRGYLYLREIYPFKVSLSYSKRSISLINSLHIMLKEIYIKNNKRYTENIVIGHTVTSETEMGQRWMGGVIAPTLGQRREDVISCFFIFNNCKYMYFYVQTPPLVDVTIYASSAHVFIVASWISEVGCTFAFKERQSLHESII